MGKNIKEGDTVLLQEFHPKSSSVFDIALEFWSFTKVRIGDRKLIARHDDTPYNPETGKCRYWGGNKEWGEVFTARIVPLRREFDAIVPDLGDSFAGDRPIFES